MDSRTQGSRPRVQKKKSEAKIKDRSLENRPRRGQKHECLGKYTTRKCSPKKNKSLLKQLQIFRKTPAFSKKRKDLRSKKSQIFSKKGRQNVFTRFLACLKTNKTNNPWPIFNKSKNMAVLEPRTGHFRELAGFD